MALAWTAIAVFTSLASPADAGAPIAKPAAPGSIGIRIMDVPVARVDDPRALAYIIDFLAPGTTIRRRVQVSNTSSVTQHIEMYAGAAAIIKDAFTFADGESGNELSGWVHLPSPSIDLAPHSSQAVMVTVAVPKKASKGERYGVIWAQVTQAPTATDTIGQINRVGIRMYLDVGPGGEPPSDFTIGDMTVVHGAKWPVITAPVDNTGGRALDMSGSLTLSSSDGTVTAGPFRVDDGVTILPGNTAPISVELNRSLPSGVWNARLTLTSGTITHTATETLTLEPNRPITIAVPPRAPSHRRAWLEAAGAALILLMLVMIVRRARRRSPIRA